MSEPRGVVQRLVVIEQGESVSFRTEYRTRDAHALFAQAEWGWGAKWEAYVFAQFHHSDPADPARSAEDHKAMLDAAGEKHVVAVVFGSDAEAARVEAARERVVKPMPAPASRGVDPSEVFAREEKRNLA